MDVEFILSGDRPSILEIQAKSRLLENGILVRMLESCNNMNLKN